MRPAVHMIPDPRTPAQEITKPDMERVVGQTDRNYISMYSGAVDTQLGRLCVKYGSDKGGHHGPDRPFTPPPHTYTDVLESKFGHCRQFVTKVFECGLGSQDLRYPNAMGPSFKPGSSLRVWRDYFPNAMIYGADIDTASLFQDFRIQTHYVDQRDQDSITEMWSAIAIEGFDLIIDDGEHTFRSNKALFEASFDKLRQGGIYIIEDLLDDTLESFREYFTGFSGGFVEFVTLWGSDIPPLDNSLCIIRKY